MIVVMLRLDPSAPPLWRDERTVQFGAEGRARFRVTAAWQNVAIDALSTGTTREAVRALGRLYGRGDDDADALLAYLAPALAEPPHDPALSLQVADDLPVSVVRAVRVGLPSSHEVIPWAGAATPAPAAGRTVVLLGAFRVDPRRAAALMRDDVPHLPLVLDPARATIGPLVVPGVTACLCCLDAAALARDEDWPVLAAQLLARPRPVVDLGFATEAARAARHVLSGRSASPERSLHLRAATPRRTWRRHRPSADCRCRSLEGSATGRAPTDPGPATS